MLGAFSLPAAANETGAPELYQHIGFRTFCAVGLIVVIALAIHATLGHIKRLYRQRMIDRHAERERIARDLHDTLLQGIHVLLFRLQDWEEDPDLPAGHREEVAAVVRQTRDIVVETCDRILMLRRAEAYPVELLEALSAPGTHGSRELNPELRISVIGHPRPLQALALEHLIEIGREAIRNSRRHAGASCVCVSVEYRKRSLILQIDDDGIGIDPALLQMPAVPGHFGVTGMRERAEQLGARIQIHRLKPRGTRVAVVVRARAAFHPARVNSTSGKLNTSVAMQ